MPMKPTGRQSVLAMVLLISRCRAALLSTTTRATCSRWICNTSVSNYFSPVSTLFRTPSCFVSRRMSTYTQMRETDMDTAVLTRTAVRKLKVAELRNELNKQGMDTTGKRTELLDRMLNCIGDGGNRSRTQQQNGDKFLLEEQTQQDDSPTMVESQTDPKLLPESPASSNPQGTMHILRVDGGSRGNPGCAGAGMVIYDPQGKEIWGGWKYLGTATNNVAEYEALLLGLQYAHSLGINRLRLESDSQLVVRQLEGRYKVKNLDLKSKHASAMKELKNFDSVDIHHIMREANTRADELANQAMDLMSSSYGIDETESFKEEAEEMEENPETPPSSTQVEVPTSKSTKGTYLLQVDGGARGNPGIAGAGMVIYDPHGGEVWSGYKYLGTATNNVAEYTAMLLGLQCAQSLGISSLRVESDSQLIVRQLEGRYRVKDAHLKELYSEVKKELKEYSTLTIRHIMRADNKRADELANQAMDTLAVYGFDEV